MKILLTGGAGYIGSACLRWLLKHDHDPIAFDNMLEGNAAAVPETPFPLAAAPLSAPCQMCQNSISADVFKIDLGTSA